MIGVEPSSDSCDRIFVDVSPALISRFSFATTSVGVPRGTPTPYQMMASYPGTVSAIAGTFGSTAERVAVVTARARILPD